MEIYLVIGFMIIYVGAIVAYINYFTCMYAEKWAKQEFNLGLSDIIINNQDINETVKKLELIYKQFRNKQGVKIREYASLKDTLDTIISMLHCKKDKYLKAYNLVELKDKKDFLIMILNKVEEEYPYSNLQSNQEWLLKTIKDMTKDSENESAKYIFKQLENEISDLNSVISKTEVQSRIGFIGTIAGIILTIFFGLLSLK